MMRHVLWSVLCVGLAACQAAAPEAAAQAPASPAEAKKQEPAKKGVAVSQSIYDIPVKTIDGKDTTLAQYKGKTLLIVNVASQCGYTRQYPGLQALWEAEKANGLVVLGFPSNDFGGQEPGSDAEIAAFCSGGKYNVDFPMFSKIQVKAGDGQHPLYKHLTEAAGSQVSWNFNKFLVGPDGKVIKRFDSRVEPQSEELLAAIRATR